MKHIVICVIVPLEHEYKLSSVFSEGRIVSLKRKNLDVEVIRLVETDSTNTEAIVLDARPESEIHLRIPETYYSSLSDKKFGLLARTLRYQMWHLDYSDRLFLNDIRSLCD